MPKKNAKSEAGSAFKRPAGAPSLDNRHRDKTGKIDLRRVLTAEDFKKGGAGRQWNDPDDAPEITDEMLDRATVVKGGKVVQRGRPRLGDRAKKSITIRLDADVVEAYRAMGSGWQTTLNEDLRRIRKLKKAG